jgi:hypothetical protein
VLPTHHRYSLYISRTLHPRSLRARPLARSPAQGCLWCLTILPGGAGDQVADTKGNDVQELMRQNQYIFNAVVELSGHFVVGCRPCQHSQAIHTYIHIRIYIRITYVRTYVRILVWLGELGRNTDVHTYQHSQAIHTYTYIYTYIHSYIDTLRISKVLYLVSFT